RAAPVRRERVAGEVLVRGARRLLRDRRGAGGRRLVEGRGAGRIRLVRLVGGRAVEVVRAGIGGSRVRRCSRPRAREDDGQPDLGPLQYAASGLPAKSWFAAPVVCCVTGVALVGAVWSKVAVPGAFALFAWSAAVPWK